MSGKHYFPTAWAFTLMLTLLSAPLRAAEPTEEPEATETLGVSMGRYHLRESRTVEGAKLRMSFALYAAIDDPGDGSLDAEVLTTRFESRTHRIRDEVITATRLCKLSDFQEPGLGRFRRRVSARLRRVLPELPIDRVLVGEFEVFYD